MDPERVAADAAEAFEAMHGLVEALRARGYDDEQVVAFALSHGLSAANERSLRIGLEMMPAAPGAA